jgi:hypothetical protein
MTYHAAMAAGRDAGNASMRKAGRTRWTQADYNAAARMFNTITQNSHVTTPSVPPSIQGLIARREAEVRSGRLSLVWSRS